MSTLIYKIIEDNFEGDVKSFIKSIDVRTFQEVHERIKKMDEDSDGERCYIPLYLVDNNDEIIMFFGEEVKK